MASKYRKYERAEIKKQEMHPLWRGVGCILFIIVPVLAYLFMTMIVPPVMATGQVPPELTRDLKFPPWVANTPVLKDAAAYLANVDDLWVKLIVFAVVLLLLITVSGLIYTMVYQFVGPPRYTEMDAPDAERGAQRYKR